MIIIYKLNLNKLIFANLKMLKIKINILKRYRYWAVLLYLLKQK